MSIHAGNILHIGGNNVIDRIQSAGLGDVRVPTDTIREVGNKEVVDKVVGDPDFTFSMESFDVSTELEALLNGKVAAGPASGSGAGAADPDGTSYDWLNCRAINIVSPWKDPLTGSAGSINAGHIVPGFYPTRISYRFGVTDNAGITVDLGGGSYYYGAFAPVEEFFTASATQAAFALASGAIGYRQGGAVGTAFSRTFGVMVNGVLQSEGVDYTESGPEDATSAAVTVTFVTGLANGDEVRIAYFTDAAQAWPDPRHAAVAVKPGAVRGRNICVYLGSGGGRVKVGGVQALTLDATVDGENTREFCNINTVGREVNGTDCNGSVTVRAKDKAAFFGLLSKVTGVAVTEVFGWFNDQTIPLSVQIQNPKTGGIIKTLYVRDAKFQLPGTPARVNTPTDFELAFESQRGSYEAIKGAYAP